MMQKISLFIISICTFIGGTFNEALSMWGSDDSSKPQKRKGFRPKDEPTPDSHAPEQSPKDELKWDPRRQEYYYGRPLDELSEEEKKNPPRVDDSGVYFDTEEKK